MTTIAVNKKQIAGDLMMTHANGISFKSTSKIVPIHNPLIYKLPVFVGFCGDVDTSQRILDFFVDPENWKPPKKMELAEFVALDVKGRMYTFSDPRKWLPLNGKFYAIGSGSHFAMGAMHMGATPKQAVEAAIKLDKSSGFGVSVYEV